MHDNSSIKIESKKLPRTNETSTEFIIELPAVTGRLSINESELIRNSRELSAFRTEEISRIEYGESINISDFMKLNKKRGRPSYLLLVDDEPLFRETVQSLLKTIPQVKEHIRVVESGSAEEVLNLFKAREFDYLIADIDLGYGKMNGYELSAEVLKHYQNTFVLIHSNKRKEEMDINVRKIMSDKFMGFLPKPMNQSELAQFLACKTLENIQPVVDVLASEKRKRKVLILNDDEALLLTFRIILKSPCVQILEASNISTAIKHITESKIDIILSDINLGDNEPTGYEFLKKVREKDKLIPFYLMSGYSKKEEEPKALENGANGYIQLPVEKGQLVELLN